LSIKFGGTPGRKTLDHAVQGSQKGSPSFREKFPTLRPKKGAIRREGGGSDGVKGEGKNMACQRWGRRATCENALQAVLMPREGARYLHIVKKVPLATNPKERTSLHSL